MARTVTTDFLHSMRFQVKCGPNFSLGGADAGFMSVSTPEATTEAVEYREGTYNYPRKFPGNTTVADISMQRGVTASDSTFWSWLSVVIHGEGEYRTDLDIYHYDRSVLQKNIPNFNSEPSAGGSAFGGRIYHIHEAFPIRCKIAGDLDASSSDISVAEADFAFEYFEAESVTGTYVDKGNLQNSANPFGKSNNLANAPAALNLNKQQGTE
jgi:phage tail-like protein